MATPFFQVFRSKPLTPVVLEMDLSFPQFALPLKCIQNMTTAHLYHCHHLCPSHLHFCNHFLNDVPASSMSPSVYSPSSSQSNPVKAQDGLCPSSAQNLPVTPILLRVKAQGHHCLQSPCLDFSDFTSSELLLILYALNILAFLLFL